MLLGQSAAFGAWLMEESWRSPGDCCSDGFWKKEGFQIRVCKLVLAETPLKCLEQVLGRGHTLEAAASLPFQQSPQQYWTTCRYYAFVLMTTRNRSPSSLFRAFLSLLWLFHACPIPSTFFHRLLRACIFTSAILSHPQTLFLSFAQHFYPLLVYS